MPSKLLSHQLDDVNEATDEFITGYVTKMQHPITFLSKVIDKMEESDDPIVNQANVNTVHRTLSLMDGLLNDLMTKLALALAAERHHA
jgi:hypothetical protein